MRKGSLAGDKISMRHPGESICCTPRLRKEAELLIVRLVGNFLMTTLVLFFLLLVSQASVIAQQDSILTPWPSTREVHPVVHARVWKTATNMTFTYKVANGTGAHQAICFFFVLIGDAQIQSVSQERFWGPGVDVFRSGRTANWGANVPSANIYSGQPGKNFSLTTGSLPGIVYSHSLGYLGPDTLDAELNYDTTGSDIVDNSVRVLTVGPGLLPSQNFPLILVDTVTSYIGRSHASGWITTQSTADKYTDLISRIRSSITQFNLKLARSRIDTVLQQANIDSSSTLTSEAYALIRFNTEYLRDKLKPTGEVKGGISMPSSAGLSVKAKPSVVFGTTDTLKSIVATVRWPAIYNVTLGTVSGAYGFSKYDSIITLGAYLYQKFRTTTSQMLNWSPGSEYEVFTVPVSGLRGAETFELTNALAGGEWFVDINYLDKTDSVFYQPVTRGSSLGNE